MLTLKNTNPYELFTFSDPALQAMICNCFPDLYPESKKNNNPLLKISSAAGKTAGKVKHFFSKNETKAATLVAYWAADAFVALVLLLTSTSVLAVTVAFALLVVHTYATFSVVNQIL